MSSDDRIKTSRVLIDTPRARWKRRFATVGVLFLIALPATGLVMVQVDRVQDAADRST
jgi:hypothetical protein